MKFIPKRLLLAAAAMACATQAASAAFTFTNGDLILGFQATGGTGSTSNVFFNLGSGISYRDGTNPSSLGNLNTTLSAVYGAGWYTRTDLNFGVVGNLNANPNPPAIGGAAAVNGDPSRTFYLSLAAATPGSASLYAANAYAPSQLGSAGTTLGGMETMIQTLNTEVDGAAILSSTQTSEWANGWTTRNPTPGAAFGVFTGGIQQSFGQVGSSTYVDLQRVLSTNTGASPTGVVGGGTYETTFAIGSDGSISAIPEPSTTLLGALGVLALFRRRRA